jgi:hypothetical protein
MCIIYPIVSHVVNCFPVDLGKESLMSQVWLKSVSAVAVIAVLVVVPLLARGDGLPAGEQAFFDKNISNVVQIVPTRLNDPGFLKVFSTPFYTVKITIKQGDGEEDNSIIVARIDDKLVSVSQPGSDADLPDFAKMLSPDFRLKADDDAKALQAALDLAYPIIGDANQKVEAFRHSGTEWVFLRGVFFDTRMGYTFVVDADGTIKSVRYGLKLPA